MEPLRYSSKKDKKKTKKKVHGNTYTNKENGYKDNQKMKVKSSRNQ